MKWVALRADSENRMPLLARSRDGDAADVGETTDDGLAVQGLEFVKVGSVHDAGDHFAYVVGRAAVGGQYAVEFFRRICGFPGFDAIHRGPIVQVAGGHRLPRQGERVFVVGGEEVGDAGDARMHIPSPQAFGIDFFAGGRFDQGWAAEKNRALVLHDDGDIAHGGYVSAACRA